MRRIAGLLVALTMVAAACGSDEGAGSLVLPFSEVQATDFVFENDPSFPDRGIFRVITTEPMICAIVWGETEALGNFNNSLDMNGTGIAEHNVFLPGAEAGETYFFVVQGSTADGRLFQSEMDTFTLPDRPEGAAALQDADVGPNLAEGAAVVDVSSEFSATWAAANALDGDLATEWSSAGDGDDAYLTIDLGAVSDVAGVEFVTRTMADGSATATTYSVVVDDGQRLGPFPAGSPASPAVNQVDVAGRVFRFEIESSTGGNTGAVEVRVFASAP